MSIQLRSYCIQLYYSGQQIVVIVDSYRSKENKLYLLTAFDVLPMTAGSFVFPRVSTLRFQGKQNKLFGSTRGNRQIRHELLFNCKIAAEKK